MIEAILAGRPSVRNARRSRSPIADRRAAHPSTRDFTLSAMTAAVLPVHARGGHGSRRD
jgi:hypothetical protein